MIKWELFLTYWIEYHCIELYFSPLHIIFYKVHYHEHWMDTRQQNCELCPDGIIPCRCGQLICMTQASSCHQDSPTPPPAAPCLMGLWALSIAKMGKNYYIHFSVSFDDDRISFGFESGIIFLRDGKIFDRGNHLHHHLNVGHTGDILTREQVEGW